MRNLILATLIALGFGAAWCGAISWLWNGAGHALRDSTFGGRYPGPEYLQIKADGTPLIKRAGPREWIEDFRDLDGNPVQLAEDEKWLMTAPLRARADYSPHFLPALFRLEYWHDSGWERRLRSFADYRQPPNSPHVWWLVADDASPRSAYFVGYDRTTNARAGFLGRNGFRDDEPPAGERFRIGSDDEALMTRVRTLQNSYRGAFYPFVSVRTAGGRGDIPVWFVYVQADDGGIYQIDLNRRTVSELPKTDDVRSIELGAPVGPEAGAGGNVLLVRTPDEIVQFDADNRRVGVPFPIPSELRDHDFNWGATSAGAIVAFTREGNELESSEQRIHYYWLDRAGAVTRLTEFTLHGNNAVYNFGERLVPGAAVPAPAAVVGFAGIYLPMVLLDSGTAASAAEAWPRALRQYWPAVLLALVVTVPLTWLCYRRQVRYSAAGLNRWFWPLFVLVLGLPGWVGYRFGRAWPALASCPACSAEVPQDRSMCAACENEFREPARKGTEVIA
jgi:hypothetical protein